MSPTTNSQPTSTSGEEWLENIRCPTFFDFEEAVAYPCTLGDDNPPLRESVYDSDDETRGFFHSLNENPSLHRTLHRRSLSPQRNRLQNAGKPLYRHRPKTTFAEYLAEFQQRQAQQASGITQKAVASSSKSDSSPARELTLQASFFHSDNTPSPQTLHDIPRTAGTAQLPKPAKPVPLRRARRSPASSVPEKVEPKATQEQLRLQAQNPARRKPRPTDRAGSQPFSSRAIRNGRMSKTPTMLLKETAKRELDGTANEMRPKHNSILAEEDDSRLNSMTTSDIVDSPSSPQILEGIKHKQPADQAFVKKMEEHNKRLWRSKSERAGSSISARTESEDAFDAGLSLEDSASVTVVMDALKITESGRCNDVKMPPSDEDDAQQSAGDTDGIDDCRRAKASLNRNDSLSELLQKENERVLEERKRRLPERRKALQQRRVNALRSIRGLNSQERRINPISTQIEFTSAETMKPVHKPNNIKRRNSRVANERKQIPTALTVRNRERGLSGYRSRMEANNPSSLPEATNSARNQQNTSSAAGSGLSVAPDDKNRSRTGLKAVTIASDTRRDEASPQTFSSSKEVVDDLHLLLSEHNTKIRRNRTAVDTINN